MTYYAYFVAVFVLLAGVFGIVRSRNLIHTVVCLSVAQSGTYVLLLAVGYQRGVHRPVFGSPPVEAEQQRHRPARAGDDADRHRRLGDGDGAAARHRGAGAQAARHGRPQRARRAGGLSQWSRSTTASRSCRRSRSPCRSWSPACCWRSGGGCRGSSSTRPRSAARSPRSSMLAVGAASLATEGRVGDLVGALDARSTATASASCWSATRSAPGIALLAACARRARAGLQLALLRRRRRALPLPRAVVPGRHGAASR